MEEASDFVARKRCKSIGRRRWTRPGHRLIAAHLSVAIGLCVALQPAFLGRFVQGVRYASLAHGERSSRLRTQAVSQPEDFELSEKIDVYTRSSEDSLQSRTEVGVPAMSDSEEHNRYQEATFDGAADFFASPAATPPDVVPRMQRIARTCQFNDDTKILDVATGTGALLPYFSEAGARLDKLTGVDLSQGMLTYAMEKFPMATFSKADINDFYPDDSHRGGPVYFDRIIFNAVFGNLFNQAATLKHVSTLLEANGLVVISHPLGRKWLRDVLHKKDPRMVPHDLPSEVALRNLIVTENLDLEVVTVDDEEDFYCAVLRLK